MHLLVIPSVRGISSTSATLVREFPYHYLISEGDSPVHFLHICCRVPVISIHKFTTELKDQQRRAHSAQLTHTL